MKNIQYILTILIFGILNFPQLGTAQEEASFDLGFEINRVSPKLTLPKSNLDKAKSLIDLNRKYEADWVREYISVEIDAYNDGKLMTASSNNDKLTDEQTNLMQMADPNTDIAVRVKYIPDNNLSQNEAKVMRFKFNVDPQTEATYPGGMTSLRKYLQVNAMDKVSPSDFKIYNLTAVKFSIDKNGEVLDVIIEESSKSEKVDVLLIDAIRKMPNWSPAQYADGTKAKREFVFTVGDHTSCVINLLDIVAIDKYLPAE